MTERAGSAGDGLFPTTDWSRVKAAGQQGEESIPALDFIYRMYERSSRIYLRSTFNGVDEEKAKDWFHDFWLQKIPGLLGRAAKERGRFRTLLLNALHNFAISQIRREKAAKRPPEGKAVPLETDGPDEPPAPGPIPGANIDRVWAEDFFTEMMRRFEAKCREAKRPELLGLFKARWLDPTLDNKPAPDYDELVKKFGFPSPAVAFNTLAAAKRMWERLGEEVAREADCGMGDGKGIMEDLKAILCGFA